MLLPDAVKTRELTQVCGAGWIAGSMRLDGGDHEVFGGVFGGDKLENLCAVARPFEQLRAQGIRDKLRLPFLENAVAQGVLQYGGRRELGAELLLATRRNDEQRGAGAEALGERIVGGRVAGMQGNQDINRAGICRANFADLEFELT